MIKQICPVLWTMNLKETLDFYTENLDFEIEECNEDLGTASLQRDGYKIMLLKPTHNVIKPTFTGSLYLHTTEVDKLWEKLKEKVDICYPIGDFEWNMREFALYDNNGYILQFGEEITA